MPMWFNLPTMQKQNSEELLLNANPTSLVSKFADVSTRLESIVVSQRFLFGSHAVWGGRGRTTTTVLKFQASLVIFSCS